MNYVTDALLLILDPRSWPGPDGIGTRLVQHALYVAAGVVTATVAAVPLGLFVGHTGRGRNLVVAATGVARSLPTFGLLLFAVLLFGLHLAPVIAVLVLLAIPPILAGTYAGVEAVGRSAVDGARGSGYSESQIVRRVELPLAMPLIVGGVRSATLQAIATATIAGYVAQGTLGRYLIEGLARHEYATAVVGALLVAGLALVADAALTIVQSLATPHGGSRTGRRTAPVSPRGPGWAAPLPEGQDPR
ncbi:ABC transporter permease [Promicromonospora sp. CA-289599]|uniref:ABC transporter permease n=1 Tax=Promicromonospora sp. CA-289599 TaxID=3240014 RepID=UPI003D8CE3DC